MPLLNVHYHFEKDALVDTIFKIAFNGNAADWGNDNVAPNVYEGVVKQVYADGQIEVAVELGGQENANWSIKVTVIIIAQTGTDGTGNPVYAETGNPINIDTDPIKGQIAGNSYCLSDKFYQIKFPV